uniref:A superfamily conotoxin Ca1.4 n=1 Tax=Conus caracteristicus TaxID=89440 RepID=S4UJP2_CONCB|nr:A superfamily conotoxin Ca1.4 precursor [Conus caracteristicus]
MGMRMMFTVFLLVVLATTVLSFTSDRASEGRNAAAKDKASDLVALRVRGCCAIHECRLQNAAYCGGIY